MAVEHGWRSVLHNEIRELRNMWLVFPQSMPYGRMASHRRDLEGRMGGQDPQRLPSGIARSPCHGNRVFRHMLFSHADVITTLPIS